MLGSDKDVRVVLVRPRNPLNIGAVARALRNFGFADLVLVSPYGPVWEESRAAPGAAQLLANARCVADLLSAVGDRTLVFGASCLARRSPSQPVISLDQLGQFLAQRGRPDRVALVFGPEKTGLRNRDLNLCHGILRIPTQPDCPSMNLGQAVAVCCYEIRRLLGSETAPVVGRDPPATMEQVMRLAETMEKLLGKELGTTRQNSLRQMLLGWSVSSKDATLLLGVLRDLSWQLRQQR